MACKPWEGLVQNPVDGTSFCAPCRRLPSGAPDTRYLFDPATGRCARGGGYKADPLMDTRSIGYAAPTLRRSALRVASPTRPMIQPTMDVGAGGTSGVSAPSFGGILEDIGRAALGGIEEGIARRLGGGGGGAPAPTGGGGFAGPATTLCPDGTFAVAGRCVDLGAALPGGDPFISSPGSSLTPAGQSMLGLFAEPAVVGEINGRPIRRCPKGLVLAIDDMCYQSVPRKFRKWKPARRPPVTGADAAAIRRAERTKKRVKKLASKVGYTCSTKGRAITKKKGKR